MYDTKQWVEEKEVEFLLIPELEHCYAEAYIRFERKNRERLLNL